MLSSFVFLVASAKPVCQQGIGPEISESVKQIFTAAKVPIVWEEVDVTPTIVDGVSTIPADAVASIRKNTIALKGPLATPSTYFSILGIRREKLD